MAATSVKFHLRVATLVVGGASFLMAAMGEAHLFLVLIGIALELYALTEMQVDWSKKYHIKGLVPLLNQRRRNSLTGAIAQLAAYLCLIGAFLSP